MNKPMKYGSVLKKLLSFTNTKFAVLAKAVGYDISYISKWCNHIKLPSPKNIATINEKAALFFSEEIIKQHKAEDFLELFPIPQPVSGDKEFLNDILTDHIYNLLHAGYEKTEEDFSPKGEKPHEKNKVIVGKNEVATYIENLIHRTIEASGTDIELISTLDICKQLDNMNFDMMEEYKFQEIRVNTKIGFDMDEFEKNPDYYVPRIYFLLNKRWNLEYNFYDHKDMDKLNIIAMKDHFAVICSLDSDGMIEVATVITDRETVSTIYDKAIVKFRTENVLIKSAERLGMDKGGYRTDFYSGDEFQFLSTRGFEFLLPSDIISHVVGAAYKQGFNSDMAFSLRKLQITWEELFEKSNINFIILRSALMKYIEEGEIFYTEVRYKLTPEQRKNHAHKVLECMQKNEKIKFIILDDELLNYKPEFFKITVFTNNRKIFLKKNMTFIPDSVPLYYTIINDKLVRYINEYLSSLKNKDFCQEYDASGIEEIAEKYGNMFFRIIEAKNYNGNL